MNTAPFIDRSSAVAVSKFGRNVDYGLVFSALMTHITREDIGNSDHQQKCGNC